jgi:hypothetical protein
MKISSLAAAAGAIALLLAAVLLWVQFIGELRCPACGAPRVVGEQQLIRARFEQISHTGDVLRAGGWERSWTAHCEISEPHVHYRCDACSYEWYERGKKGIPEPLPRSSGMTSQGEGSAGVLKARSR